jgi:protein-S-isoprenylcysteine O-methyltransferase Ste14
MNTVKTIIGSTIVIGIACVLIPYFILQGGEISATELNSVFQYVAIPVGILGLLMVTWVAASFVRTGKGTPIPIEPPKHLVIQGLFRYLRNPMYAGALLILLADLLYFPSLWLLIYTAVLWTILHIFVVFIEEPQLKRRFGAEYEQYIESVPRWIPHLRR